MIHHSIVGVVVAWPDCIESCVGQARKGIADWWGVHLGPVLGMGKVAILVPEDRAPTWM